MPLRAPGADRNRALFQSGFSNAPLQVCVDNSPVLFGPFSSRATVTSFGAVESAIEGVEEAMKSDDKETIEAATTKLTEAAQVIYQQAAAAAEAEAEAGAQDAGPSAEAATDDVVDAEFEEVDENKDEDK